MSFTEELLLSHEIAHVQPDAQEARNYHFLEFLHARANAEEQGPLKWFCQRPKAAEALEVTCL